MKQVQDDRLLDVGSVSGMKAELTGEEIELGGALVPEEFRPILLSGMLSEGSAIRPKRNGRPDGLRLNSSAGYSGRRPQQWHACSEAYQVRLARS